MICADRDIILLNKKLDMETRREVYIPTQISGVSIYDNRQSSRGGEFHEESEAFKIRVPIRARVQDGRTYLPETHYDALTAEEAAAYWTLHTEDMIIVCATDFRVRDWCCHYATGGRNGGLHRLPKRAYSYCGLL